MKTRTKIIGALVCLSLWPGLYAQVTVGIEEAPAEGALLQLKEIKDAISQGGKNTEKGLLLPRVRLKNATSLDPMFPNAGEDDKKKHAGLIVYNLTIDEDQFLKRGLMVWNGQEWNAISAQERNKKVTTIKKKLTKGTTASANNTVMIDSLKIWQTTTNAPQLTRDPALAAGTRTYHYQIAQYWPSTTSGLSAEYRNDVMKAEFNSSSYKTPVYFINRGITTQGKNDVWMIDDTTGEIYHCDFLVMGNAKDYSTTKIFAILAESF